MRQLTFLLICLSFTMNVFADNKDVAQQAYDKAKGQYTQGLSKEGDEAIVLLEKAKEGFKICQNLCKKSLFKVLEKEDREDLDRYISKCEDAIRLKRQQAKDKLEAAKREEERAKAAAVERAAAERVAAELEAKRQKRIDDKLVYVSSDAYIFDTQYPDMHRVIKRYLSDAGFEFTDNPELAYWSVYVAAIAYERNITLEGFYRSAVDVCVKIVNEVDNGKIVCEDEIPENVGTYAPSDNQNDMTNGFCYAQAARVAYQKKVNKEIGELIVRKLKK